MPPSNTLAALMASPATSGGDATVMANGQTLPDISLGSLGSSFKSDDEDYVQQVGLSNPPSRGNRRRSAETLHSQTISTPSPPRGALFTVSPPPTVRKSSSHSALPTTQAPRRPRVLHRRNSNSSVESDDLSGPLEARYGKEEGTDDEAILSALSLTSPKKEYEAGKGRSYAVEASAKSGRHNVAAGELNGPMTLRDQEKQLEETKKEVFNLQLENHFLKERLSNMAPEHIEGALKENVKLKLEILTLGKELKKLKKLVMQQDKDLAAAARESGKSQEARELEKLWNQEKERRKAAEQEIKTLQEEIGARGMNELRSKLEDAEASEDVWRKRTEELEAELEDQKALNEDQIQELERFRNGMDRAHDEMEKMKEELKSAKSLNESVGLGKGREARLAQKIQELEQENASLQADLSIAKKGVMSEDDAELLEERLNELQDKVAAAQLELDNRDREVDELNAELDTKFREHEIELQQVAEEWRDEVLEARTQVDELKDQELKEIRDSLLEREEHLTGALEEIQELQAAKAITHDRLEETLKNIERDNAEKDADLIDANREIENLGHRVYELEEALEDHRAREADLNADLRSADEEFENAKAHYEDLISVLKEARRKIQEEKEEAITRLCQEKEERRSDRESIKRELGTENSRLRQALSEKEVQASRLQSELDAARERLSLRDHDLSKVERKLYDLEDERRKLGDEHTSNRFGLELEVDRVKRDLQRCEDELDIAKRELEKKNENLRDRDIELATMLDKQRDIENKLSSERQGRLNISDKLDQTLKTAKQHEREANLLRERIEELEPLLTETQQERFQLQKQSETQRQERSELLLRVFKDVNKFLGLEHHTTPANFTLFKDTLLQRLKSMMSVRAEFEKKLKDTEASVDQRMASLKRQVEEKWRTLDQFETAVKKLELTKREWRSKFAIKEGELQAVQARNKELSSQISSLKSDTATGSSSQIRSLTERAIAAEKRAQTASNQLASLEERLAEYQTRYGQAEDKWEARVKEYENRLRIAGEKIKTEKQGGKERALQLEAQVRELENQVQEARKRNQRAEGVVASAAHLLPGYEQRGGRTPR
ncbi:hypothetical protein I305_01825 [Cryptococcus gattii E566]|uniref:Centrosomin N-terminal motif 1 domain-containing protein n=1 Tax=Cryptococcus gattii serotype B (strain WM276 / ATCC MYA-4071) TaxID=367775 RepID=E6R3Z7_CRYGW|nr:uncharacterized protein CGB_D4700W [Cryptococcus gattii WM276]ADV21779.1 Conserved hypothetical protein [Cryptococcus gattii WM276]KIY35576.1 hypothetical protein I305_01825 [Cryptococcus gattii E566]